MGEIRYDPFWRTIESKGITQYGLINQYGFTTNLLHRLRNNLPITTTTIGDICEKIDCDVSDVIEYIKP